MTQTPNLLPLEPLPEVAAGSVSGLRLRHVFNVPEERTEELLESVSEESLTSGVRDLIEFGKKIAIGMSSRMMFRLRASTYSTRDIFDLNDSGEVYFLGMRVIIEGPRNGVTVFLYEAV